MARKKIGNLFQIAEVQLRREVIQRRRLTFDMVDVVDRAEELRHLLDQIERLGE